jgi:hypothetical protein
VTEDLDRAEEDVLAAVGDVTKRLGNTQDIARASYASPRLIDHYIEGSVIAYYGELVEEIIAAEQRGLTEGGRGAPEAAEEEAPPRAQESRLKEVES